MAFFTIFHFSLNYSKLEGFLNLKHLTKKVVSQNYQLSDSIGRAVFKQFRVVTKDTVLGLVSRILETDEFVAVVDEAPDRQVSVITHLDLLDFIANDSAKTAESKSVLNGIPSLNEANTYGFTNGYAYGHANGYENGHTQNGHANGHSANGH